MEKTLEDRIKLLESDFNELKRILRGIVTALNEDAVIKEKNTIKRIIIWMEKKEYKNLMNLTHLNEFFIKITPHEVPNPAPSVERKRKKRGE